MQGLNKEHNIRDFLM